ncbi:MAG: rhomboid family intramembrane serine protease [Victivallaceae bacterium]|nr:rhomboid family intramembrane serine protease [Victivallaceae bacterium]
MQDNERSGRIALFAILAINVIYYIFNPGGCPLVVHDGMFAIRQLLLAGFSHASFTHLLFNMWALYLFGGLVAPRVGAAKFVQLYLAGLLSGNLLFLALSWNGMAALVGSSGAMYGVMIAAAMLDPERRFCLIFLPTTPVKAPTLVISLMAIEIICQLFAPGSGIAHLAHLGGLLGGYLFTRFALRDFVDWDPLARRRNPDAPAFTSMDKGNAEIIAILGKMARNGVNSLTPEEYRKVHEFHSRNKDR